MELNHEKYPIIIGSKYINEEQEIGTLEIAEIFPEKNGAHIEIDMHNAGRWYKLNYDTFCFNWRLFKENVVDQNSDGYWNMQTFAAGRRD